MTNVSFSKVGQRSHSRSHIHNLCYMYYRKGLVTRNTHAKYDCPSISKNEKVKANVKYRCLWNTNAPPPFSNISRTGLIFDLDLSPTDLNINRGHLLIKDYLPTEIEVSGAKHSDRQHPFLKSLTWILIWVIYSSRTIYLLRLKFLGQSIRTDNIHSWSRRDVTAYMTITIKPEKLRILRLDIWGTVSAFIVDLNADIRGDFTNITADYQKLRLDIHVGVGI